MEIDPRAQLIEWPSTSLGVNGRMYIYTPPEYDPDGPALPVVYLLRGHEREWINRREDDSRIGSAIDVYERVRARGEIGPMLLVMPGLASTDNRIPGLLADFIAPQLTDAPGIGHGRFATFFFDEVLPLVEHQFNAHPRARAITGFSLGGYMAIKAVAMRPELFVSVSAYDGSFPYASDCGRRPRRYDTLFTAPMFDPALGRPRNWQQLHDHNPICLLMQADRTALRRISWMIQYGPEHIEPWGSNFYRGEYLLRALATLGIANATPQAALPDGAHTWAVADRHLEQALPLHYRAFERIIQKDP
ncbi:MAG: esterase [Chloroflexus sp.]|nr:esterase [Chloroflexus sp.]